ncbi:Armadillo-like helical containing protein [Cryptosporidium meleagridis]
MIKRRIRYTEIEVSDVTDSDSCGSDDEAILNKYCPIASKNKPAYVQYVDILSYSTLLFFVSIILYVSLISFKNKMILLIIFTNNISI